MSDRTNRTLTRREFASTAAMAALSAAIAPRRVFGRQAPGGKLNIAAIGVGGMGAANLKACEAENIVALCESMSDNDSSSRFQVADAGRGVTHLDRSLWAEWFIHQEKPRMKEVLSLYWQNGRRSSKSASSGCSGMMGNKEVTSSGLLSEICDGIRKRRYGEDNEPRDGIELGVFVIRRTN